MFSALPQGVCTVKSNNRFLAGAAVVVFLAYYSKLMISSPALLQDPDTLWHIVTGQWILNHARVPTVDFYSYTQAGKPWISTEWLAEIAFATIGIVSSIVAVPSVLHCHSVDCINGCSD
jgi:hypothetical protein